MEAPLIANDVAVLVPVLENVIVRLCVVKMGIEPKLRLGVFIVIEIVPTPVIEADKLTVLTPVL